ncbi:MAG: translocation/assembly module TamB [Flavobacterium sp.]|nr:translocation/assembly module TamB [Flavobacterium sp.]
MKKIAVKILKVLGYLFLFLIILFLSITIALQIPKVQYYVKEKAVSYLENKIKTKVKIDKVEIGLPKLVILEGVYFEDQFKNVLLSAKKIKVNISLLKLIDNKIEINSIDLNTVTANLYKNKNDIFNFEYIIKAFSTPKKADDNSPPMEFSIDKINLDLIKFSFIDDFSKSKIFVNLNHFDTKIKTFNLKNELIEIKNLNLKNTSVSFVLEQLIKTNTETISEKKSNNWKIKVEDSELNNVNFIYDDNNLIALKKGIDYNHLNIKNFNLKAENLDYNSETISGKINSLATNEKSGLVIENLKTDFFYGQNESFLNNLFLKTPTTIVQKKIIIKYNTVDDISKNLSELDINANLDNSKIGIKDILIFVPKLEENKLFANNINSEIVINTKISGKLKNITIPNLELSGIGNTKIAVSGKIIGLPDFQKSIFDLKIKNLQTTSKDIFEIIPKNTIPKNITIPKQILIQGNFIGKIDDFKTNIKLVSSFGNLTIFNARFNNQRKNKEKFVAQTEFFDFDLGKLIQNKSLGKMTLKANVNGVGFDPKTSNILVDGSILKFDYNQYSYRDLKLNGKINNGLFNVKAISRDKNLKFDLIANGSFKNKYPSGKINLNVDYADLQKVKIYGQPMKIRGKLNANIQTADIDYLNAKISLDDFTIANTKEQFALDSITITAISTSKNKLIKLKSQFANANINGKYKLSKIATAVQNSISKYYNINLKNRKLKVENQNLSFDILIKESPILFKLIPNLKALESVNVSGKYNSINDSIVLNGTIPKLIYGENNITNAIIKVDKIDNSLTYNLFIEDLQTPQFQLPHTTLFGKLEDDILDYNLQIKDLKDVDKYYVAGKLNSKNAITEIFLEPTKLLLNYEKWNISTENQIKYSKNLLYVNNFELSKTGNSIKIQSQSENSNSPININFKDFQIATILNIAQKKELQIDGRISGNAILKNIFKTPLFTSDLNVNDFVYKNTTVGNLNIKVDNNIANNYNTKITLTGQDNQVLLSGIFKSSDNSLEMILNIDKLNLKSLEGFTDANIKESTGFLSGKININGKVDKPNIIGDLQFNEIGFKATKLNAKFQSLNDKIVFTTNQISFNKFKIKDEKNNDLTINGKINSTDFSNLGFDLTIDGDNFNAVNSKEKDNSLYYGTLFLDNHLKVKGTVKSPIVDGNIKINKDTKFTIVLPQDDPSIADREGIVEFIDQDSPKLIGNLKTDENLSQSDIKGINASVNIEIDKESELSLVIDKANGDFLKLKGEGQLNGGIDQSGKTTLTGRYDLNEGSYEMNFNLIKRKFDIKKGSYLLWTGEPTTADVNITAVYKLDTAPIDLLNDQLGNLSPETRNTYKQKIPFETELKMKGELLKPEISFNIVLPEGNNSVSTEIINATQAKLTQLRQEPDELNKQVFALLLLNRFIGENPFASESGGTTAQGLARESASKILSQQLNNLAGDLIKGVELDFNLNSTEDYTTGQKQNKTDLNVGLSKTLLNDRLKVTFGSSFGIEGPKQENEKQNTVGGDLSADYQLTKDGRYKVRAYRKNKYQVALQGQVIETGVGFIITIDYNKFKELFQKSKK